MTLLQNHSVGLNMTIIWNPIIAPNVSWVPHFNSISSKSGTGTFQPSKTLPTKTHSATAEWLNNKQPKPTPFDGCYKCLPLPAQVPTRDRGNSDRNPVPRVKTLSELMDVSPLWAWLFVDTSDQQKNKLANRAAKIPGSKLLLIGWSINFNSIQS